MKEPNKKLPKREFLLRLMELLRTQSDDPDTQCACVIVPEKEDNRLVCSLGVNRAPGRVPPEDINWERPGKYSWVVHAEIDALGKWPGSVPGVMYLSHPPCSRCALAIAESSVVKIVYVNRGYHSKTSEDWDLSRDILKKARVDLEEVKDDRLISINHMISNLENLIDS